MEAAPDCARGKVVGALFFRGVFHASQFHFGGKRFGEDAGTDAVCLLKMGKRSLGIALRQHVLAHIEFGLAALAGGLIGIRIRREGDCVRGFQVAEQQIHDRRRPAFGMDRERLMLQSARVILSRPRTGKMEPDKWVGIRSIERQALLKICHCIVPLPQIELGASLTLKRVRIVGLSANRGGEIFESAGILAKFQVNIAAVGESGGGSGRANGRVEVFERLFIFAFGTVYVAAIA